MIEAIVTIKGVTPYGQNGFIKSAKLPKESPQDYEQRTWRERMTIEDGEMVIPAMAFKNCLSNAAKYLGEQIPGKGKATYTKHFEAGVSVFENGRLGVRAENVKPHEQFVPSDGKRGGGTRVLKYFPVIPAGWECTITFLIFDHTITKDVFVRHLQQAGNFIGLGWFRPRNNGTYGRFTVEDVKWKPLSEGV